jgi:hypothetical protein
VIWFKKTSIPTVRKVIMTKIEEIPVIEASEVPEKKITEEVPMIVFSDPRTGITHGPIPVSEWSVYEKANDL